MQYISEGGPLETETGLIPDPSSLNVSLNNLRLFTNYNVFVTAVNRAGNSTGSEVFMTAEAGESVMSHDSHTTVT